jgi:hypothetical protein
VVAKMVAILRLAPGEDAPWEGTYALVGHYGEPAGVAQWFAKGGQLPLATADAEYPLWYVLIGEADISSQAA